MTETKNSLPKDHRLEPGRFQLAEYGQRHIIVKCEQGVTLEYLKDPAYWANFGHMMSPWDIIQARTDDGTLWAELLVLSCGRAWARVHVLRHVDLTTADVDQSSAATQTSYKYAFRGPRKHSIVRSDGEVMVEGKETKAEALAWAVANRVELTTA